MEKSTIIGILLFLLSIYFVIVIIEITKEEPLIFPLLLNDYPKYYPVYMDDDRHNKSRSIIFDKLNAGYFYSDNPEIFFIENTNMNEILKYYNWNR